MPLDKRPNLDLQQPELVYDLFQMQPEQKNRGNSENEPRAIHLLSPRPGRPSVPSQMWQAERKRKSWKRGILRFPSTRPISASDRTLISRNAACSDSNARLEKKNHDSDARPRPSTLIKLTARPPP